MAKIIQLPPYMADLIAAGEVVERPASVIKELVENSIDAGAKTITVEIQNGGMTFMRVQDDGCGMAPEDAEIAFLRHATSKLRRPEDLEAIGTLGFRGEALAATAAVSRIDLLTRTADTLEGLQLHLEAGEILSRQPAGSPVGTTMIVRDLFYNTPARMKFMKRDTTEASAVLSALQKQALAHPEIAFRFLRDGEMILQTPGDGDLQAAIYAVLGRQTALEMIAVDSTWEKTRVFGFVTKPTAARGTRNYQNFFVNGRYVKSRTLSAALEEAYRNQLMQGRFPACVLNLALPLGRVDVNVHPAKTEVKFLQEKEMFDCVHYGVLAALNRTPGRVEMSLTSSRRKAEQEPAQEPPGAGGKPPISPPARPQAPAKSQPMTVARGAPSRAFQTMSTQEFRAMLSQAEKVQPSKTVTRAVFSPIRETALDVHDPVLFPTAPKAPAEASQRPAQPSAARAAAPVPEEPSANVQVKPPQQQSLPVQEQPYRVVGEVLETYIIVEQQGEVLFIDKHAAHERILFEKLKNQGQAVMGQMLMAPITCAMAPEEAALVTQNKQLLLSLGYDADDLGDGAVLLRQLPEGIDPEEGEASLSALVAQLLSGRDTSRDALLHSIACQAAIKAGYHTQDREREYLVRQVLGREDLKYCPHGRPICVTLTQKQLEKQFRRIP